MVWDLLKRELRGITIEYSIKKAKRTRQYVHELNEEPGDSVLKAFLHKKTIMG